MKHKNNHIRIGGCILATILTLGCYFFGTQPDLSEELSAVPVTETSLTNTPLPPLPDFPEEILFFGYGGGGGVGCGGFSLPPVPSAIGGTTYPTTVTAHESYTGVGPSFYYPRHAVLCFGGVPKDVTIEIKLTSPDQDVTLSAAIQIIDDSTGSNLLVKWNGYPDDWLENDSGFYFSSYAAREGDDNRDANAPIIVSLGLWWSGSLPRGVWKVEVSWPVQFIYGDFFAETTYLPEVSMGDPNFDTQIFPDMNSDAPYTCRPVLYEQPYFAVVEGFSPGTPVHILVYHVTQAGWDQELALDYQTVAHSNEQGMSSASLSTIFSPGIKYYLLAVTDPSANLAVDTGSHNSVFNFTAIANAMDCFFIP